MQTKIVRHAFIFFISSKDWQIPTFYYFIKDEVRSNTISFSMILNSLFVRFIQHHDYYIIILLYICDFCRGSYMFICSKYYTHFVHVCAKIICRIFWNITKDYEHWNFGLTT